MFIVLRTQSQCPNGKYWDGSTCQNCHRLCRRCHGPTNADCDQCESSVPNNGALVGTICECSDGYFYDSTQSTPSSYCQPCPALCEKCTNGSCTDCVATQGVVLSGSVCVCSSFGYYQATNAITGGAYCDNCHPLCMTCTGPLSTQCASCDLSKMAVFASPSTCACPGKYYYDMGTTNCEPCDPLCAQCIGASANECIWCDPATGHGVVGSPGLCVAQCAQGYFVDPISNDCTRNPFSHFVFSRRLITLI